MDMFNLFLNKKNIKAKIILEKKLKKPLFLL